MIEAPAKERLQPLRREFFRRSTDVVAREMLGVWLCREVNGQLTIGWIVETEAYGGPEDRASHARAGLTRRTTPMFGEVGHAYVYLIYGMHECLNVVAHGEGETAGAVLLRAVEPVAGVELMRARRGRAVDPDDRLASGPARLCQAMAVDRSLDGHDLIKGDQLWLSHGDSDAELVAPADTQLVLTGPRVGVDYAGEWSSRPWRFWLDGNASVSRR